MNPNPFLSLKNLTLPVDIIKLLIKRCEITI